MELKKYGEIKHLISYSINKIGLVFKVSNDNSEILYVFVTPKKIQKYVELSVDYKVYYENEYKKLHLEDDWNSIRGY
ncbi:MAG: hypothetical protein CFE24_14050 [Flavobacterium sp. BFFFF2]|nr:MAG: hypothetical protein CFE24_14050 [Flavobacterium sp. BFFFF2]